MTGSRIKVLLLIALAATAGVAFLAWSQEWVAVTLVSVASLSVTGSTAAPALTALALATLALVAALAIAGPHVRIVLGVIAALLGAGVIVSAAAALGNPVHASAAAITAATGVAGDASVADLAAIVHVSGWPIVAVIAGAAQMLVGLAISATWRRWPASGRRYASSAEAPGGADAVSEWDALSDGDDPTSR